MKSSAAGLVVVLSVCMPSAFAANRCPSVHAPVCALGTNGQRADFEDSCSAERKGAKVLHSGTCEASGVAAMCSHLYEPVCAIDPATGQQKTYPNLCTSEQANAKSVHDGECGA